jgi:hypothetical protein
MISQKSDLNDRIFYLVTHVFSNKCKSFEVINPQNHSASMNSKLTNILIGSNLKLI